MSTPRSRARRSALVGATVLGVLLTAGCGQSLPASVAEGSSITVGWEQTLTTLNPASTGGGAGAATEGDREVASLTHDAFARLVDGEVVTDPAFGTVAVTDPDPASFSVRYDLADRTWSDGVPLDAADLVLAWAAGSDDGGGFESQPTDLRSSTAVPTVDEFARSIDVAYTTPVDGWQTALDVAVPAHVVGQEALGIDDPMAAKQAVVDAITDDDAAALAKISAVWNTGFDLGDQTGDQTGDLPDRLTVASGPYQVTGVATSASGADHVTLGVNSAYGGEATPTFEHVDVVPAEKPLEQFPTDLDVAQVSPTPENFRTVRDLGRRDQNVATTNDGRLWALVLRADQGVFRATDARRAFLRASPRTDLTQGGAGAWSDAYPATQSLLFAPEADGYTIALEDAGLVAAFEASTADPAQERAAAGVPAGTAVCVLYDTGDPFAVGAYQALATATAESGWKVRDCGRAGIDQAVRKQKTWQAVLTTVPLPQSPDDIAQVWGGKQRSELTGVKSAARARLVATMDRTPDHYDARDLEVRIEAGLVKQALALPLTLEPVITLSKRGLNLVQPDSGGTATLLSGAADWSPES